MKSPLKLVDVASYPPVRLTEMPSRADEVATSPSTHAHARACDSESDYDLVADLLTVVARAVRQTESVVARLTWREATASRARRIGVILDARPQLVPTLPTRKVKRSGAWEVLVTDAAGDTVSVMSVRTDGPKCTLEQLAEPIPVEVHRPDLIDAVLLRQLEERGVLRLVARPASTT